MAGAALGVPGSIIGGGAHQAEYGNMQVPSVWRRPGDRTSASARVDALSSGGMDELEIPAFLRRQAD
jgi:cell division protein FtsZ